MTPIFTLLLIAVAGAILVVAPCTACAFDVGKISVVSISVSVMVIIWAVQVLRTGRFEGFGNTRNVNLAILLYICSVAISVVFSLEWLTSLVGIYKRYDGFISLLVYVSLFLIAANFVTRKNVELLISTIIWSGVACGVFALVQKYNAIYSHDVMRPVLKQIWPSSTIGNPAFFAMLMSVMIPLVTYKVLCKRVSWRYIYIFALAILVAGLVVSNTRCAVIAVAVSMAVFFYFGCPAKNRWLAFLVCLRIAVVVAALAYVLKLSVITKFLNGNYSDRLDLYACMVPLIKNNWLTGIGLGTVLESGAQQTHNETAQQLVSYGILGLGAYIYLLVCICKDVWKFYGDEDNKLLIVTLFCGCLAGLVAIQFNPGSIPLTTVCWVLLGAIYGIKNTYPCGKFRYIPSR